ncbi:MAG: amidase family protein, partial [Pseudomonadota bacterium]
ESYLDAIAAHPMADRIFTVVTPDRARASAAAAADRARLGIRRSLFDGVPITWKDLISVAGTPTRGGSVLTDPAPALSDAPIVARAQAAGMVTLGKTHQTELAFSGLGVNPVTATPPNVNNPDLAPGGSSSGAAASLGYGLTALAIGSDTGGSIRLPAAWNNVVGFKPTFGALPIEGCLGLVETLDTLGPIARSVEDAAIATALLGGAPPPDLRPSPLDGRRIAVMRGVACEDLQSQPAMAFDDALRSLADAGAILSDMTFPSVDEAMDVFAPFYGAQTWGLWGEAIEKDPGAMHPPVLARFRAGKEVMGATFVAARATLDRARAGFASAARAFDAIALPTSPILPPATADLLADDALFTERNLFCLRNTRIANLLGLTAISLPTGTASCGLMLMGLPGTENRLLRLAHGVETHLAEMQQNQSLGRA